MEGIGALGLLDIHLLLHIVISKVYKICGIRIHTYTHTPPHKCTKSHGYLLYQHLFDYTKSKSMH